MHQVIAHVDLDCFFAAAETLVNPTYKHKPLIVGGRKDTPRGVVCTANYEARKFGVHSAMPIWKAAQLCPQGEFIPCTKGLYSAESDKIMSVLRSFTHIFKQTSIDEAFLDISHLVESSDDWIRVARHIRASVFEKTGYTCSVGVSESRRVAKIASGHRKPHGITVVHDSCAFLDPLPIGTIPGIGKVSVKEFIAEDVLTVGDLGRLDIFTAMDLFGKHIVAHHHLARGEDASQITAECVEKSISHESTFEADVFSRYVIRIELEKLVDKVFARCEREFKTVSIKLRFSDFTTITRSTSFANPAMDKELFLKGILKLFEGVELTQAIRLVGVKVDNLVLNDENQTLLLAFTQESLAPELQLLQ